MSYDNVYRLPGPTELPPGCSYADLDDATAASDLTARVADVAALLNVHLDAFDAEVNGGVLDVGRITSLTAATLVARGDAVVTASYVMADHNGRPSVPSRWRTHLTLTGADGGEDATAFCDTSERPWWAGEES